jgi:hypothetical protein
VPRSLAFALPAAVGAPVVVTGGQAPAHAPLQLDESPVSFTHRYTARPELLVRNVPAEDDAVSMTVPPDALALLLLLLLLEDDPVVGEAGAAAAVLLLLPALLQAATISAAPTPPPTPATTLARPDTRVNTDFPIVLVSRPARSSAPARLKNCRYMYGRSANRDCC